VEYVAAIVAYSNKSVTARRMVFKRLMDFSCGHYPRKCVIFSRHFLCFDGLDRKYCDGLDPNDEKGRFCRQIAGGRNRREHPSAKEHPVKHICQTLISANNRYLVS
jgi:hypothetical protein